MVKRKKKKHKKCCQTCKFEKLKLGMQDPCFTCLGGWGSDEKFCNWVHKNTSDKALKRRLEKEKAYWDAFWKECESDPEFKRIINKFEEVIGLKKKGGVAQLG